MLHTCRRCNSTWEGYFIQARPERFEVDQESREVLRCDNCIDQADEPGTEIQCDECHQFFAPAVMKACTVRCPHPSAAWPRILEDRALCQSCINVVRAKSGHAIVAMAKL